LKAEAEARARAEEEARLKAEARAKAEEEARLKAEAHARAEEEARLKAEARAKAEEEARLKAEARAKAEEEARLKAEEARARAEEEARRKEEEARARAEEEARAREEAEARAKAEEEARLKAEEARARAEEENERAITAKAKEDPIEVTVINVEKLKEVPEGIAKKNNAGLQKGFLDQLTSGVPSNQHGLAQSMVLGTSNADALTDQKVQKKKQKKMSDMTKTEMIDYLAKFPPIVPKPYCEFRINGRIIRGQLEKKTGEMVFIKQGYGKRPLKCDVRQIEKVAIINL
ncbi:hypothetical protein D0469_10255, partial [Peribacillus saganii]